MKDSARWCKMVQDGARCCKLVQDGDDDDDDDVAPELSQNVIFVCSEENMGNNRLTPWDIFCQQHEDRLKEKR